MSPPIVTFNNIVKNIDYFQLKASEISFSQGEITAIIGEKGAGKTTFLELLMDLRKPDSGTIERSIASDNDTIQAFKTHVGFVYEDLYFYDFGKLSDMASMMRELYPTWDQAEFHKHTADFNLPIGQKFRDFSPEQRMKTMLAVSLAHHPKLLIMDEPVKTLETKTRFQLFKTLRQINKNTGMTIILTAESASAVEKFAANVLFLHEGEFVLSGRTRDLKKQYKTLDIAYKSVIGGSNHG
jgi:ABC-2 type transport system ATP-binding protein